MNQLPPIPYLAEPKEGLLCAGQPDAEALRALAAQGLKLVINLRPAAEMEFDEAALVKELGMAYASIPVAGAEDLNQDNARKLSDLLTQNAGQSVLVHCASSNRVGALIALGAVLDGAGEDDALHAGREAGLTKLEPVVQTIISQWRT